MSKEEYDQLLVEYRKNRQIAEGVGLVALAALIGGSVFYHFVEDLKWLDAFYFSTITLATIGYGDIAPQTDLGKLFTIFYALIGIGIIGAFANFIFKNALLRRQLKSKAKLIK